MPYSIERKVESGLLICRLCGPVEGEELCTAVDEIIRLSRSQEETVNVCWDGRDIQMLAVSPSDVGEIVSRMNRFAKAHPRGRTAIVTTRMVDYIIAKLLVLKAYANPRDRQSFESMDEAVEWASAPYPSNA